jgi:hypothetical protein
MLPLHIVRAAAAHTAPVPQNPFFLRQQRGKSDVAPSKTTSAGNKPASETFFRTGLPPSYCTFLVYNNACALGKRQRHSVFMPAVRFSTPSPDQHVTQQQDALTRVSIARGENVRIRARVVESCRRLPACFLASSLFAASRASGVPACSAVRTP